MPIEVKELVVRVVVNQNSSSLSNKNGIEKVNKKEIVNDCVHKVLEILEKRRER